MIRTILLCPLWSFTVSSRPSRSARNIENYTCAKLCWYFQVELVGANPRYICWDCTNILIRLHQFREMCLQSEKCLSTTLSDSNDFQDQRQSEDENSPKIDQIDCRQSATQFSSVSTSKRPRYECDMCGQTFFKKHRIEAHLRNKFGLKPFRCTDCGVSFRKFCSLRAHQRRQHPSDGTAPTRFAPKKYACTVSGCQRAYTERSSLSLHCQRKHSDAPPTARLVCDACGQVCPSNSAFQEHMWRHRDPAEYPYACELCPKRFINKYAFQTHQNRHRNIRNFQCTLCDARTYTKAELDIHTAYHNKAPTVVCEQCPDKRFTTKCMYRRYSWKMRCAVITVLFFFYSGAPSSCENCSRRPQAVCLCRLWIGFQYQTRDAESSFAPYRRKTSRMSGVRSTVHAAGHDENAFESSHQTDKSLCRRWPRWQLPKTSHILNSRLHESQNVSYLQ